MIIPLKIHDALPPVLGLLCSTIFSKVTIAVPLAVRTQANADHFVEVRPSRACRLDASGLPQLLHTHPRIEVPHQASVCAKITEVMRVDSLDSLLDDHLGPLALIGCPHV